MRPSVGAVAPPLRVVDTNGDIIIEPWSSAATVIVFTCNHCPYALSWQRRINNVAEDYRARGVKFIHINPNGPDGHPSEVPEVMQQRVEDAEIPAPFIWDADQSMAFAWGATVTPEIFVVDPDGSIAYHGAPDSDHSDESRAAQWIRDTLDDLLAGRTVRKPATSVRGCSIKWRVEVLHSSVCPSDDEAIAIVRQLLSEMGRAGVSVHARLVENQQRAIELDFTGSPTIRVGTIDLFPPAAEEQPALGCRIYRLPDGRVSPLPDRSALRAALESALYRPADRLG